MLIQAVCRGCEVSKKRLLSLFQQAIQKCDLKLISEDNYCEVMFEDLYSRHIVDTEYHYYEGKLVLDQNDYVDQLLLLYNDQSFIRMLLTYYDFFRGVLLIKSLLSSTVHDFIQSALSCAQEINGHILFPVVYCKEMEWLYGNLINKISEASLKRSDILECMSSLEYIHKQTNVSEKFTQRLLSCIDDHAPRLVKSAVLSGDEQFVKQFKSTTRSIFDSLESTADEIILTTVCMKVLEMIKRQEDKHITLFLLDFLLSVSDGFDQYLDMINTELLGHFFSRCMSHSRAAVQSNAIIIVYKFVVFYEFELLLCGDLFFLKKLCNLIAGERVSAAIVSSQLLLVLSNQLSESKFLVNCPCFYGMIKKATNSPFHEIKSSTAQLLLSLFCRQGVRIPSGFVQFVFGISAHVSDYMFVSSFIDHLVFYMLHTGLDVNLKSVFNRLSIQLFILHIERSSVMASLALKTLLINVDMIELDMPVINFLNDLWYQISIYIDSKIEDKPFLCQALSSLYNTMLFLFNNTALCFKSNFHAIMIALLERVLDCCVLDDSLFSDRAIVSGATEMVGLLRSGLFSVANQPVRPIQTRSASECYAEEISLG